MLTTKSDHNDMRPEAVRSDTWMSLYPGQRRYRTDLPRALQARGKSVRERRGE
jgi:hypothetical protein